MATERLTVKNFGPIQEADLDLRKVTVLIGEQASGKSVLAKLVAIFRNVQFVASQDTNDWFNRFMIFQYLSPDTIIQYDSEQYFIKIANSEIQIYNAKKQQILLNKIQTFKSKRRGTYNFTEEHLRILQEENAQLKALTEAVQKHGQDAIYIPAERILISTLAESSFSLQLSQVTLPQFLLMFGSEYERSRKQTVAFETKGLGIKYSYQGSTDFVEYNNTTTKLSESASGLQSIVPLLLVIENTCKNDFLSKLNFRFIIEEPELNLYPTTQKKLVEYLIEKCTKGDNRLIITTHSPYILTALNNCIEANNVLKSNPEAKEKVDKLVPPESQIAYGDVAAYFVANGTAKSIMNEEYQMIDANALDDVSEELSRVYDSLLDLKYQPQD